MSDNPFQSPQSYSDQPVVGVLSGKREDLRSVAKYQRGIMFCILIYLAAFLFQFLLPPEIRPLLGLLILGVGLAGTVFVFLLAMKVYSTAVGILLGIGTLIPCLGLVILLIVNGKATQILKANGIQVGLLGANLAEI